jgi:hypothetical protein
MSETKFRYLVQDVKFLTFSIKKNVVACRDLTKDDQLSSLTKNNHRRTQWILHLQHS